MLIVQFHAGEWRSECSSQSFAFEPSLILVQIDFIQSGHVVLRIPWDFSRSVFFLEGLELDRFSSQIVCGSKLRDM